MGLVRRVYARMLKVSQPRFFRLVAASVLCISVGMAAPGLSQLERIARVPWSFSDLVFCGISLKILEVCVS